MTRGIRNNNPGNIKDFGIPWEGLATQDEMTVKQRLEDTFCVFSKPWWGIRAMAKILLSYQVRYNLNTIAQIINRWAPSTDNNPVEEYADFVARHMKISTDEFLTLSNYYVMYELCEAIILFENGLNNPYNCEITTGLILANIEP